MCWPPLKELFMPNTQVSEPVASFFAVVNKHDNQRS